MFYKFIFTFFALLFFCLAVYFYGPFGDREAKHQTTAEQFVSLNQEVDDVQNSPVIADEEATAENDFCFDRTERRNHKCPKQKVDIFTLKERECWVVAQGVDIENRIHNFTDQPICSEDPEGQLCPSDMPVSFCYYPRNETCLNRGLYFDRYECEPTDYVIDEGSVIQERDYSCDTKKWTDWQDIFTSCAIQKQSTVKACEIYEETREQSCHDDSKTGHVKETRKKICDDGTWTPWVAIENNCGCKEPFYEARETVCPEDSIGNLHQIRFKNDQTCAWQEWQDVANECINNCSVNNDQRKLRLENSRFSCTSDPINESDICRVPRMHQYQVFCIDMNESCKTSRQFQTDFCVGGTGYLMNDYSCENWCENVECQSGQVETEQRICAKGLFGQAIYTRQCDGKGRFSDWEYNADKSTCKTLTGTAASCEPGTKQYRRQACVIGQGNVVQSRECDDAGQFSAWSKRDLSACR